MDEIFFFHTTNLGEVIHMTFFIFSSVLGSIQEGYNIGDRYWFKYDLVFGPIDAFFVSVVTKKSHTMVTLCLLLVSFHDQPPYYHLITLKVLDLSPRYFVKNDLIYGPIDTFFISIVIWKVIHRPIFVFYSATEW